VRVATETRENVKNAVHRLAADGLLDLASGEPRTTRKWQGAMARAALRLYQQGDSGDDLRVPIALALVECYGVTLNDDELADCVEAMLPIQIASLGLGGVSEG
jgi:hypothetical protein